MDFGLHLPLIDFGSNPFTLNQLVEYAETGQRLGFGGLAVNDHMLFSRPWLDGPTALAAVVAHSDGMDLATTVSLPVVRGPVPLAKTLGAVDRLSGGRLIACVGPGSSVRDYAAVGISFEERWKRLDEAIQALRALWDPDDLAFKGNFYNTEGIRLEPLPARRGGPPIWVGSWGSTAGLRRVARLADGWLASGYNTTPDLFTKGWELLHQFLVQEGRNPDSFPNALATMWLYVTEDERDAERMISDILAPALKRPIPELRERLPIGSAQDCAAKLAAYQKVGVQRIYLWPLANELEQIQVVRSEVLPLIDGMDKP